MTKRALRAAGRRVHAGDPAGRLAASAKLRMHLEGWDVFRKAPRIAMFAGLAWEPDLLPFVAPLGGRACFPVADPATLHLEFHPVADPAALRPGAYGILEPAKTGPVVDWSADDLILVPGSVFDRRGYRVGGGLGFYDRFLARCPARTCGVLFFEQIVPKVPEDPWDIAVETLCTDQGFLAPTGRLR